MDSNISKVREALEAITKAKSKISDLCHGREQWHMSIPADPENDPDIVIMDGLHKAEVALSAIDPEAIRRECAEGAVTLYEYWHGKTDRSDRLRVAILSGEPVQDDGKPEGTIEKVKGNSARYLCIIRNIRNKQSKAWNKRTMNWVLLRDYFGLGSTMANRWCEWLEIDPDEYQAEAKRRLEEAKE